MSKSKVSFLIKVDYTANNNFQGLIHWLEEDKIIKFKNAMEMLELMRKAQVQTPEINWEHADRVLDINQQLSE